MATENIELAVLSERVAKMLDDFDRVREIASDQHKATNQLTELRADIKTLNTNTERLFNALSEQATVLADHSQRLQSHSTIWKICGTMLVICSSLVGWGYSTIQSLKDADVAAERRIINIEYHVKALEEASHNAHN